ncbi:MAG: O-antigen ligase family protein [Balneolaceae bacterium]
MNSTNYILADSLFQKLFLSPLGLNRENGLVFWMILLFTTLLSGGLYYTGGNLPLVTGVMYLTLLLIISLIKIEVSLYLMVLSILLFEQYDIPGFETFTREVSFFSNLKEIPYVPYFHRGMVSPFEIHLTFLIIGLMIHAAIRKDFRFKPLIAPVAYLLFVLAFVFAFANGFRNGGDYMVALWEVRALFYFFLMYLIVPQIIDSTSQIRVFIWICIIGISFKALQGVYRFIDLGFTTGGYAVLTNHEDPVFMVTLFVLLMGLSLYLANDPQRKWILLLLLLLMLGFYVAQRRATYASLIVSVTTFILILPAHNRVRFMKYFLPVLAILILYGIAGWNHTGTFGRPVQMIKSGIVQPDKETNFADYSSNLYRDIENYNLAQTVVRNPLIGTGFGVKYDQPIPLVQIRFPLREYIPHNQIYWLVVKTGSLGFFAFWFFFNSFAAKGTQIFIRLKDPYLKSVSLMIVIAIINQMVVSFFDLQLTYYRNMTYLGCLMGLLPVIHQLTIDEENSESNAATDES